MLKILWERNPVFLKEKAVKDISTLSKISDKLLYEFTYFCMHHKEAYELVDSSIQTLILEKAKNTPSIHLNLWFLANSLEEHFLSLKDIHDERVKDQMLKAPRYERLAIKHLNYLSKEYGIYPSFKELMIYLYVNSESYDCADASFKTYILPILKNLDSSELENLVSNANKNSQCYDRKLAKRDHEKISAVYEDITGHPVDDSKYSNFI